MAEEADGMPSPEETQQARANEIREAYFTLIRDIRPGKRSDAEALLASSEDENIRKLADIGKIVFTLMNGEITPSSMKELSLALSALPMTDFWAGIVETSAQVLMGSAMQLADDNPKKAALMEKGLELAAFAMSEGLPLKEMTIDMARKCRSISTGAGERAGFILRRNESLKPAGTLPITKKKEDKPDAKKPRQKGMLN